MAQVFISHKTEEKQIALDIKEYLSCCLISAWVDLEEISAGEKLGTSIIEGIANSNYFIALISSRYVSSNWCMHELEEACGRQVNGSIQIIPILIDSRDSLGIDQLSSSRARILESVLSSSLYVKYDQYDHKKSMNKIADAIGKFNQVAFDTIKTKKIRESEFQVINFRITTDDGALPTDIFRRWNINIGHDFLAHHENESKPLRAGKPVIISGKGPNWLGAYLAIQFKNLCSVYLFNNNTQDYICVYTMSSNEQGRVLKEN
jgi:TIR domain